RWQSADLGTVRRADAGERHGNLHRSSLDPRRTLALAVPRDSSQRERSRLADDHPNPSRRSHLHTLMDDPARLLTGHIGTRLGTLCNVLHSAEPVPTREYPSSARAVLRTLCEPGVSPLAPQPGR